MSQIEITPALLSDLRQKAEAATPGPWKVKIVQAGHSPGGWLRTCSWVLQRDESDLPYTEEDGVKNHTYIAAASPDVVLALVAEIERLNERYDERKLLSTMMITHAAEQKKEIERLRNRLDALECPNCGNQPKFCMCEVAPLSGSEIDFVTKLEASNGNQA